ncbi:hypothetical protein, partial [Caldivirga sp.]|uniref:hypothetical protein n=1 Tax=Caldivirga sp. TaxID=2080243 RepID=UPI003D0B0385
MRSDVGASLMIIGVSLAVVGYIEPGLIPLMVLGLSAFIVGLLVQWDEGAMEQTIINLSSAAWDNVSALVESAGLANSGVYLPSSMANGEPMVLVPSTPVGNLRNLRVIGKPLATYGAGLTGLLLASPGSRAISQCRDSLSNDLEASLRNCIVRQLSLAKGVSISEAATGPVVRIDGPRPIDLYGSSMVKAVLGSTIASIVASIVAEVL